MLNEIDRRPAAQQFGWRVSALLLCLCMGCGEAYPAAVVSGDPPLAQADTTFPVSSQASSVARAPSAGSAPIEPATAPVRVAAGTSGSAASAGESGTVVAASAGMGGVTANAGASGDASGPVASSAAGASASGDKNRDLQPVSVWIAGDSTVMTYDAASSRLEGWGQELSMFLAAEASVNNQALGGRSTRTFVYNNVICVDGKADYTGGKPDKTGARWERIEKGIKPGDFCLIQFGHNDEAKEYCERYVELPTFKENLTQMIRVIRDRQATPILVTPMSRMRFNNGVFHATLTDYSGAMKEVANKETVELVDLNSMSVAFYQQAGYERVSTEIFEPGGNTHFLKQGAIEMARLVSEGLAANGGKLGDYIKPQK